MSIFASINKKIIILSVVTILILVSVVWMFVNKYHRAQKESPSSLISTSTSNSSTTSVLTTTTQEIKTYRNEQWGFEFQYPEGWTLHENILNSPSSKLNLIGTAPEEKVPNTIIPSLLVNVVAPDFAFKWTIDKKNLGATTTAVVVGGRLGIKYEYYFSGTSQIGIDVSFYNHHFLLSAPRQYEKVLEQALSTFDFFYGYNADFRLRTYRNEQWGFEFQYPEEWVVVREDKSVNYYSKLLLVISSPIIFNNEKRLDEAFLVNIVLPEFTRGFNGIEKNTSEIIVGGVRGVKYEYTFEGSPETAIILPFGELKIILGTGGGSKQYLDEFNQIISTFKFLK